MKRYIIWDKEGKQVEVTDLSKSSTSKDVQIRTDARKVKEVR